MFEYFCVFLYCRVFVVAKTSTYNIMHFSLAFLISFFPICNIQYFPVFIT